MPLIFYSDQFLPNSSDVFLVTLEFFNPLIIHIHFICHEVFLYPQDLCRMPAVITEDSEIQITST